ncbi:chondroitin AC/alginate lyase [Cunninghamella echinulata]|nr:chondroitin AC/alginate lyase [Cunninghamella echinulata]
MASVWYDNPKDKELLKKVMQGLDFWFDNDYTEEDCTSNGGKAYKNCPCGTPGFWNPNWYSQVIGNPRSIGNVCLLIHDDLTLQQKQQCIKFTSRSYSLIHQYNGSNLLEVAYNGISLALLKKDPLILQDALDRVSQDTMIASKDIDGINMDGSYLYHDHELYSGNYGEVHLINMLMIFDMMPNTVWSPPNATRQAFAHLVTGSEWMMFGLNLNKNSKKKNNLTQYIRSPLLWQYSALSRMISVKSEDLQNTAGILLNITQLDKVTKKWTPLPILTPISTSSINDNTTTTTNKTYSLSSTVRRLQQPYSSANQGRLLGTRYFWNSEYLIHRSHGFVTTLKLISHRTSTPECLNGQNTKGIHLNDGSLFTYQRGDEYLDTFGAWNWYKVPGTTTINKNESITCTRKKYDGKESFVGAAVLEESQMGVAVLNFTDPTKINDDNQLDNDDFIGWQKSFFFFPSMYAVHIDMIPSITPTTTTTTTNITDTNTINATTTNTADTKKRNPYITTLDQKRRNGDILVNGKLIKEPNGIIDQVTSLWHDKILYTFDQPLQVHLDTNSYTSDWASIGVSKGNESVPLWSATIPTYPTATNKNKNKKDESPLLSWSYIVQPNFGVHRLKHDFVPPIEFIETDQARGALSRADRAVGLVFWQPGSVEVPWDGESDDEDATDVYIETIHPLLVFLQQRKDHTWLLSISDPTHTLTSTTVTISVDQEEIPISHHFDLPQDQFLGSSVIKILEDEP